MPSSRTPSAGATPEKGTGVTRRGHSNRLARLATPLFAATAGAVLGALFSLLALERIVDRFATNHLAGDGDLAVLGAFLLILGVTSGLALGSFLLAATTILVRAPSPVLLALTPVCIGFWLQALLRFDLVRVVTTPAYAGAVVLGFLLLSSLALGGRPPSRAGLLGLISTCVLLVGGGLWLDFRFIRKSDELFATGLNLALLGAGHAAAALLSRAGHGTSHPATGRLRLVVALGSAFVALVLATLPLGSAARVAFSPDRAAPSTAAPDTESSGWPRAPGVPPGLSFVIVSVDTLRADHVGIYGYEKPTTPAADRFFGEGVVFQNAYAPSSWTLPSHASMLTGLLPSRHGAELSPIQTRGRIDPIDEDVPTLAELLAAGGYVTAAFTGGGYVGPPWGIDRGFELFRAARSTRIREVLDGALPWLGSVGDRPFFLFLHAFDVHRYAPGDEHPALPEPEYRGKLRGLRARGERVLEAYCAADGFRSASEADLAYLRWLYDTELRWLDSELERLFAALESAGRLDRTVVIMTSDHGEEFGEHGSTGHSFNMYDSLLRVPLMIRGPGFVRGRIGDLSRTIDIVPTVLHLAGRPAALADRFQGRSLVPSLYGVEETVGRDASVAEADVLACRAAFVTNRYKLIDNGRLRFDPFRAANGLLFLRSLLEPYRSGFELYDLERDPGEVVNVASRHAGLVRSLVDRLDAALGDRGAGPVSGVLSGKERMDDGTEEQLRALGYVE